MRLEDEDDLVRDPLAGLKRIDVSKILLRGPLERTGTDACSFCSRPDHDELFVRWSRGELSSGDVGAVAGVDRSTWMTHLYRHVPGWETARSEVCAIHGGEVERLRHRVIDEMSRARDPLDRVHLLDMSLLIMRAYMVAAVEGVGPNPKLMSSAERVMQRVSMLTRERESLLREREEHAAKLEQMTEGDARRELEQFGSELREVLLEHPEVYKEVMDRHDVWRRERLGSEVTD